MEKNIKNILVPLNFSKSSDEAVKTGIAMCKRHGAALHLLEIKSGKRFVYPTGKSAQLIAMRLKSRNDELAFMERYTEEISREHEIETFYHIHEGRFCRTVAEVADSFLCDLIILQQDNPGPLDALLKNIRAVDVIRETDCPVMTLPLNGFSREFKSICFPVWATRPLVDKLEISLPIIKKNDSRVILLGSLKSKNDPWELNMVEKLAGSVTALMSLTTKKVEKHLEETPGTARTILDKAMDKKSDLLVISSQLGRGIKSAFVPSYTEQIISKATIPVISVP